MTRVELPDAELWEGELRAIGGVVLVRTGGAVHAYRDRCAHLGQPLSTGTLVDGVLTCAAHHWTYDACTGCGINPPGARLVRYPVVIADGVITVEVP